MNDILDILRDWHADALKNNTNEASFIKQIIDEIASLRYQTQNPGLNLTVGDWQKIDKITVYAQHKKSCGHVYGKCTCGFDAVVSEYDRVRNPGKYPNSEEE